MAETLSIMSECVKRITIIEKIQVTGSLGTVLWFVPFTQYCFEDTQDLEIGCECHAISGTLMHYYRVVINDEDFLIPDVVAAMQMYDQPAYKQTSRAWIEKQTEQPADMWATYKELTGIDIKAGNTVVHNGYDIWKKGQENDKARIGTDTEK